VLWDVHTVVGWGIELVTARKPNKHVLNSSKRSEAVEAPETFVVEVADINKCNFETHSVQRAVEGVFKLSCLIH